MNRWIRVDSASPTDPKFAELGKQLGIRPAEAFGLSAAVWCSMGEHAVDGDLSKVDDGTLERWALWDGRRGRFAIAFRTLFVDEGGVLRGWRERQGKLAEQMERDRKRHRTEPTSSPGDSKEPPRKPPRKLRGTHRGNSSLHNITKQEASTPLTSFGGAGAPIPESPGTDPPASLLAPAAVSPHPTNTTTRGGWPAQVSQLLRNRGIRCEPGKAGAMLSPAVDEFGSERVIKALEGFFQYGVTLYKQQPQFVTLETFCKNPSVWVQEVSPDPGLTQ